VNQPIISLAAIRPDNDTMKTVASTPAPSSLLFPHPHSIPIKRTEYKLGMTVYRCVCTDGHLGTSQITSSQSLMLLLLVVVCVLQTWTVSLYLDVDLARTAAWLFITLARQSGTCCQMNLEILKTSIVLNGFYQRDAMLARVFVIATCLSVCPSVTRRYCA